MVKYFFVVIYWHKFIEYWEHIKRNDLSLFEVILEQKYIETYKYMYQLMIEKNSYEEYHRHMQEYSTSQNIFMVNIFYKIDCVEQNYYFSHKYEWSCSFVVVYCSRLQQKNNLIHICVNNFNNIENKLNVMMSVYIISSFIIWTL